MEDLRAIDVLIFKGRAEYQETINIWKMDTHIMNYFSKEESPPKPRGFLENFYGKLKIFIISVFICIYIIIN